MCHLFVQKCFKLLMKHSSQADDKVNIYIENCLSCDQNQMHIILCSLSACYFLSFCELHFMSVSAGYNCNKYIWSSCVDILIIHHNLYSISQTQWIIKPPNNAQPLPQCPSSLPLRSYHSRYWPTSDCCPSSPSDLYQKTLISLIIVQAVKCLWISKLCA